MLFSSNLFLFLFLPTTLFVYYLLHRPYRNPWLLFVSLLFYAWGEPQFVLVMLGSILFNYGAAMLIDRFRHRPALTKLLLILAVIGNLSVLFIYKYLDFFIANLNRFGRPWGLDIPLQGLALPIGISFFTFQALSYVIDVYRKTVPVQKKLHYVGLYIAFFPQLIAGPIVRYQTIAEQIEHRRECFDDFSIGAQRFFIGFSKKVLLANHMAIIADLAFQIPDAERSVLFAWLGAIAYSFQILFDFSGYSDMAIGLGKMFGFHFLENFDYPYLSASISEFWRRWHISLGQWFRDYVYFPLGGSRVKSKARLVLNLFCVWALTGAWHGASWNFILWGLLYFVLIAFEKLSGYPARFQSPAAKLLYRIFTLLCVMGGWVLFRSNGASGAIGYALSMLGLGGNSLTCANAQMALREYWLFLLLSVLCATDFLRRIRRRVDASPAPLQAVANTLVVAGYAFCFLWAASFIILGAHNPFIYFNF